MFVLENVCLSTRGYPTCIPLYYFEVLLPLATSQFVGNNREIEVSSIFLPVLLIVVGGELMTIEDPLLSAHGYQWLPLATSQLVGNNR